MSVPWQMHWMSGLIARRELARLAPSTLARTLLIVSVGEFAVMIVLDRLRVPWGAWTGLLDAFLLGVVVAVPLYFLAFRPAARVAARAAAAPVEAHFRSVVDAVSDAIVVSEAAGTILFCNPSVQAVFGAERVLLRGQSLSRFLADSPVPPDLAGAAGAATEKMGLAEREACRWDGSRFPAEVSSRPVSVGKSCFQVTVVRDISERKRAEAALRASEERYRTLFEAVPVGLYRTTPAGQIVDANPAIIEMLGYPDRQTYLRVNASELYVNPEDRKRWQALMEREEVVRGFETQVRRHDGNVLWVVDNARAARGASGEVLYYEGSWEDLSERKRLQLMESILPVCCLCGKVRDDTSTEKGRGPWRSLEEYVIDHSDTQLSHGFCPECYRTYRKQEGLDPQEPET